MKHRNAMSLVAAMLVAGAAAARHSGASLRNGRIVASRLGHEGQKKQSLNPFVAKFPNEYNVYPFRCPTGDLRVGCMEDKQTEQRKYYHKEVPKEDREPMTPEVCYDFCIKVSGTQYFGLQGGDECYCTPFFEQAGELATGECDMPCVGDNTRMCGGMDRSEMYSVHDCHNLPPVKCTRAPVGVEGAVVFNSSSYPLTGTVCANAKNTLLSSDNFHCLVQCLDGYQLVKNNIRCVEQGNPLTYSWGQVTGTAVCAPTACPRPPDVPGATHPYHKINYPDDITYTCDVGYSLNGSHTGLKSFVVKCLEDGTYSDPQSCEKIKCGKCPASLNDAVAVEDGLKVYMDLCSYRCKDGYTLDQNALGLKEFQTTCLASGQFSEAPTCKAVSCGTPEVLHAAELTDGPDTPTVEYPQELQYECKAGHTLTGSAGGRTRFSRTCQADGQFSPAGQCKPVLCGPPKQVDHATYSTAALRYNESVTYTCDFGYTLTGLAGGTTQVVATCGADGQFPGAKPVCLPVSCGTTPDLPKAKLEDGVAPGPVKFNSNPVLYRCDPGYSTTAQDDPFAPSSNVFSITCKGNGDFSVPPSCVNIDDCQASYCGPQGHCNDVDPPTGVPSDDFICKCDAGYEVTRLNSTTRPNFIEQRCTDIDDCPTENACGGTNANGFPRGTCKDLIMNYTCACGSGYQLATLENAPENHTCEPVSCGTPVQGVNASQVGTGPLLTDTNYDTPPWTYECDPGFTLTGEASGSKEFEVRCTYHGVFTGMKTCLPVTCGSPPQVSHAMMDPGLEEMYFPQRIAYHCTESYSLDGKTDGSTTFDVVCKDDGTKTPEKQCKPMECGAAPTLPNASDSTGKAVYTLGEKARVACDDGHSLNGTLHPELVSYDLPCEDLGRWAVVRPCVPIQCGAAPEALHTTRDAGIKLYTQKTKYTLDEGYTLNGKPDGPKEFSVTCLANATFTPHRPVLPVVCGRAPERENASRPRTNHTYGESAAYTCLHGYSLNGEAEATSHFNMTCTAAGNYSGPIGCKPVSCGEVTPPAHAKQVADTHGRNLSSLVYGQQARYQCKPGYSRDGQLNSVKVLMNVTCKPDGALYYPSPCINNDDCASASNQCSQNGACVDNAEPTGVHFQDFHCACDSGFKESSTGGVRRCYNVDNCPKDACRPGSCNDLVNNYECQCPDGYYEGSNSQKGWAHDCLPVSCGQPPIVDHASTSKAGKEIFFAEAPVAYECQEGYSLDGSAEGLFSFSLTCLANRSFQLPPVCHPVRCAEAPEVAHATYPTGQVFVFPQKVAYTCQSGYSTDTKPGPRNTRFEVECKADGTFTPHMTCQAIKCPEIPNLGQVTVNHTGEVLAYPQSIRLTCVAGHALHPDKHQATSYEVSCNEHGTLTYNPEQHQCVPISCGPLPTVEDATVSGSKLFGGSVTVTCNTGFSVDRTTVPTSKTYQIACQSSGSFGSTRPCLPVSCNWPPVVRNATRTSAGGEQFFGDQVTYDVQKGFTLDGTPQGAKTFSIACLATGLFSPHAPPQPVNCGPAPDRPNANNSGAAHVFPQSEAYTCARGHSTDGAASGPKAFVLSCGADGKYLGPDGCQLVKCTQAPVPPNSKLKAGSSVELVFGERAAFSCLPGYSLNGSLNGDVNFFTQCLATGVASTHPGCVNMDDCVGGLCKPHGNCVDLASPTGTHIDDYKCQCDSGFEENITADGQSRFCGNIPDCPAGACHPGGCKDKVNDYECVCPEGYHEAANEAKGWAHDCLPVSCGQPPVVSHADRQVQAALGVAVGEPPEGEGSEVFFTSPPVQYVCKQGYTLDAVAGGDDNFSLKCQADGNFPTPPACRPVSCGSAPEVDKASYTSGDYVFPQTIEYSCDNGYYVNGSRIETSSFEVSCEAEGHFQGVEACVAVPCPLPTGAEPFGPNVAFDAATAGALVFPEAFTATCLSGFSLNKDDHEKTAFEVTCGSDGSHKYREVQGATLSGQPACTAIDCGEVPEVANAEVTGGTRYGDVLTARAEAGYSLDGSAHEALYAFNFTCQATGQFGVMQTFQRVKCGFAPRVDHTSRAGPRPPAEAEKVFQDQVLYTLVDGYTLNGTADGEKEFGIVCQADGTFTPIFDPKPVSCGSAPSRLNALPPSGNFTFDQEAAYQCATGFSIDGQASSTKSFNLRCTADGTFTGPEECKPVLCGSVTSPEHAAQVPDNTGRQLTELVYGEQALFRCNTGFSTDGLLGSALLNITVTCQASGSLHYRGECINNDDCSSPLNHCSPHGACVDKAAPTGVHIDDFRCDCVSGYMDQVTTATAATTSTGATPSPWSAFAGLWELSYTNTFVCWYNISASGSVTSCPEADGAHEGQLTSSNDPECPGQPCARLVGVYADQKYELITVSGGMLKIKHWDVGAFCCTGTGIKQASTRACVNVEDCPADACSPGRCEDLVNDYKCVCPDGYYQAANPSKNIEHDCLPVACGEPPVLPQATTELHGQQIHFDHEPVHYECAEGYTVDGAPEGDAYFSVTCRASGTFSSHPGCSPVACGLPPLVQNTDTLTVRSDMFFGQETEYMCQSGHSTDGSAEGDKSFLASCEADGEMSGLSECEPVACPEVSDSDAFGSNALWDMEAASSMKFGDSIQVTCQPGYAVDKDDHEAKTFPITCLANGQHSVPTHSCVAIDCGGPPVVENALVTGSTRYGGVLTYKAEKGYSWTGAVGDDTAKVNCLADGSYSTLPTFQLIQCGEAPRIANTRSVDLLTAGGSLLQFAESFEEAATAELPGAPIGGGRRGSRGLAVRRVPSAGKRPAAAAMPPFQLLAREGGTRSAVFPRYGEGVRYTCSTGYVLDARPNATELASDPKMLLMACGPEGKLKRFEPRGELESQSCVPINCEVPSTPDALEFPVIERGESRLRPYRALQPFMCRPGYSLNGKPTGEISFTERCQANGTLSSENQCKDIDWCIDNRCGHGTCHDGELAYTCKCDAGYSRETGDGSLETCVQINECDTQEGDERCGDGGPAGRCEDGTMKYTCVCNQGYEVRKVDNTDRESCEPVICKELPTHPDATSPLQGTKLTFKQTATYSCSPGYTLTGNATGATEFTVKCLADANLSPFSDCIPIDCGELDPIPHATANASSLRFGEVAVLTCKPGYTPTGHPTQAEVSIAADPENNGRKCGGPEDARRIFYKRGSAVTPEACTAACVSDSRCVAFSAVWDEQWCIGCTEALDTPHRRAVAFKKVKEEVEEEVDFIVQCTESGAMTTVTQQCLPVDCGEPPHVAHAQRIVEPLHFSETRNVTCNDGYTINGQADGSKTFTLSCSADGTFGGVQACVPVRCGAPSSVANAQLPLHNLSYPQQFQATCNIGYTINGQPDGDRSFAASCAANGTFTGLKNCTRVTCGVPPPSGNAVASSDEQFYGDTETWMCKEGYSLDGTASGRADFTRQCLADGEFGPATPKECEDINHCLGNPCSANGVCNDLGAGKPAPGYNCTCLDGYEVKTLADGSETCEEDDCKGNPCGDGGVCTDLSKETGEANAHRCDCHEGYKLAEPEPGNFTCVRKVCLTGLPANINNVLMSGGLPSVSVSTWHGGPHHTDSALGTPLLTAGDTATYTCAEGYSTDGVAGPRGRTFSVQCKLDGELSRTIDSANECVPVRCNPGDLQAMPNAEQTNSRTDYYEFGDVTRFGCVSGYTLDGQVGGQTNFSFQCGSNGEFNNSGTSFQCSPVECPMPSVLYAQPSEPGPITYGTAITYECHHGHVLPGGSDTRFVVTCGVDGQVHPTPPECGPVGCGAVPAQPNSDILVSSHDVQGASTASQGRVSYVPMPQGFTMTHLHASAHVVCKSGFFAAGQPFYELSCQRDGSFSAVTASCQRPLFGVSGRVTDAQSASITLAGVLITFKVDGYTVAEVTTDSWGLFAAQLPTGQVQVTAAKDGYIESTIDVDVTGTISPGGGADFVLSKVLASGEYRVVLTWAATSRDLDSHTIFGSPSTRKVYFGNKKVTDTVSGLTVTLDRDDTSGWGPETTTFEGVGACKQHCLLVFKVDNWTPYSADIGQSKAVITLYRGSGVEKVWHIPESAGAARIVTIFTLDATEGREAVYDGEVKAPPSLTEGSSWVGGYESWRYSFDYDTWSKLASGRLLSGLKGDSLSALHKLSYGYYVEVAGSEGMTCQEDDWSGWFDGNEGWQECPVGSYLAGFYRRGNKWDSTVEAGQITRAWCCKPQENPAQWGSCHQVTLFEQAWTKYDCGRNAAGQLTAMVGMHLSEAGVPYNKRLSALNKAKCCAFPQMDIITPSR